MDNYRNKTRKVQIGDVCIGGGAKNCDPVYDKYKDGRCRSMCGTDF